MLTTEERAAIRARLTQGTFDGGMQSICGEYNCDCHYEMPALLDHIDALEQDRDCWRAAAEGHAAANQTLGEEMTACGRQYRLLEQQVQRLRGYARHTLDCLADSCRKPRCTCGLPALLAEVGAG